MATVRHLSHPRSPSGIPRSAARRRGLAAHAARSSRAPRCAPAEGRHHCGTTRCACEEFDGNAERRPIPSGRRTPRPDVTSTLCRTSRRTGRGA
ncbi:hypothetical protein P354_40685 [Streptomyces noursei PD-1]|nr:hypothetical protein P354_40685 [Streptomyces noursei PD-1]